MRMINVTHVMILVSENYCDCNSVTFSLIILNIFNAHVILWYYIIKNFLSFFSRRFEKKIVK